MVQSFRDLMVWQKSVVLVEAVYRATGKFPREELFGLTAQIRRAAVSIPSNIAEGKAMGGLGYLRHLRIALGSEAELQTQLEVAVRLMFLDRAGATQLLEDAAEVGKMLSALLRSLSRHKAQKTRGGANEFARPLVFGRPDGLTA